MTADIDAYVMALVDSAPPLSASQRDRLHVLLQGKSSAGMISLPPIRKPKPVKVALYHRYDRHGALLYIGIANDPKARTSQHSRSSPWFTFEARYDVQWFDTRAEAEAAEVEAIKRDRPLFNVVHNDTAMVAEAVAYLIEHDATHLLRLA